MDISVRMQALHALRESERQQRELAQSLAADRSKLAAGTGEILLHLTGHTSLVNDIAFSPDGLTGYSTGFDGAFRVWDLREYISGGG